MAENWVDVGAAPELSATPLRRIKPNDRDIALSFRNEKFGAVSNTCNHVGGPLGEGRRDGDYIVGKIHRRSGGGEPRFRARPLSRLPVKVDDGRVLVKRA